MIAPVSLALLALVQDSGVAYVPKAGGPPDTSGYMWAGYLIAAFVYAAYLALLLRRIARENRLAASAGSAAAGTGTGARAGAFPDRAQ